MATALTRRASGMDVRAAEVEAEKLLAIETVQLRGGQRPGKRWSRLGDRHPPHGRIYAFRPTRKDCSRDLGPRRWRRGRRRKRGVFDAEEGRSRSRPTPECRQ
jgi:hypothetical protein